MSNIPCSTCPWRKSSTVGGGDIPGFSIDLMRKLANTVGEGDGLRPIFACHWSEPGVEAPCVGYVAVEGYGNIEIRLMAAQGEIDLRAIWDACDPLDLWPSFREMLAAYEEASSDAP